MDNKVEGISQDVHKLVRGQVAQEHELILDWLTTTDYAPQHNDFISRRQEETGEWLLNSNEFQSWLTTDKSTLFCPGIPGAGKTIITAIVIDYLHRKFQGDPDIGIGYIYCNFRQQDNQKAHDLISILLKQLAQRRVLLDENVKCLYDKHQGNRTRPSTDEISRTHSLLAASFSRVFIVIDALDECEGSARARLLTELFGMQAKTGANIFATSRDNPEITARFKKSLSLEVRATEEDVGKYLDGHMFQLPGFVRDTPNCKTK